MHIRSGFFRRVLAASTLLLISDPLDSSQEHYSAPVPDEEGTFNVPKTLETALL